MFTATLAGTATTLANGPYGPGWHGQGWDGPPFPFFLIPLFWLVVLAAIVTTVILVRRRGGRLASAHAGERVLAERYAAGEIADEEFRARRAVLREKPGRNTSGK